MNYDNLNRSFHRRWLWWWERHFASNLFASVSSSSTDREFLNLSVKSSWLVDLVSWWCSRWVSVALRWLKYSSSGLPRFLSLHRIWFSRLVVVVWWPWSHACVAVACGLWRWHVGCGGSLFDWRSVWGLWICFSSEFFQRFYLFLLVLFSPAFIFIYMD